MRLLRERLAPWQHSMQWYKGNYTAPKSFKEFRIELGIEQWFTSIAHPQTNGLVKVINRTILQGLKKRLKGAKGNWIEEFPCVLWSYRTTPRKAMG